MGGRAGQGCAGLPSAAVCWLRHLTLLLPREPLCRTALPALPVHHPLQAKYCSEACQRKAWSEHKKTCVLPGGNKGSKGAASGSGGGSAGAAGRSG